MKKYSSHRQRERERETEEDRETDISRERDKNIGRIRTNKLKSPTSRRAV